MTIENKPWIYRQWPNGWGNSIQFAGRIEGTNKWDVYGFRQRRPEVGDVLLARMESGKVLRFEFLIVKHETDPPDMFQGTVEAHEYIAEGETVPEESKHAGGTHYLV